MAKDGIHAILMVFSVRTRFSEEEQATFLTLQALFGHQIVDYMIVFFTGGDDLEANEETLDDYLGCECPQPLKVSCKYHLYLYILIFLSHSFQAGSLIFERNDNHKYKSLGRI